MYEIYSVGFQVAKRPGLLDHGAGVLPGCFSAGDTFEEAQRNVAEAIALHIEGILEEGHEIPVDGEFNVAHADVSLKAIS